MEKIDDVELLIYCATRLWSSVEGYPDLVSSFVPLNDYIKLHFDKGFPQLQAKYGERDERIESYITILNELVCT
jgi:hypothetical protein